ncbi:uncharacterized protein [Euphorbia lathyris]|uniref:uncharacterized protein n=1 Tax=Euphorbia lathyris TaxID=212925 RepID=UPI00331425F7
MAPKKLSEYERKRLENIRRNDEVMAALKICSKVSQLSAAIKPQRVELTKSFKVGPEKRKPKLDSTNLIRRSLRTQGMPPDLTDSDVETPPPNQFHKFTGPISMSDAYTGTHSDRPLIDTILSLQRKPLGEFVLPIKKEIDIKDGVLSFDCGIEIVKKEMEICMDLQSMKLKPENIARLMPGRITVVKFLPCNDVRMIAAGNETGNVAFWKLGSLGGDGDGIYLYRPHTAPISGILFQQSCLSKIFTSSNDGFVRMMNAEKEVFDQIYSSDNAILSLSQRPNDMNGLYFGEGRGGLRILDERTGRISSQWMMHEDRINSIDFNSQNPNVMATASSDGTACLWDLRSVNAEKPNSLKIVKHNRAVHSACFSPSGSFLATTSADDTVGIFNCADFEDNSLIYHGRGVSSISFRCIWGWDDTYMYMGNTKRGVDVISRLQGRAILTLESPYMSAIPCRYDIHPYNIGMLAGATAGGQVYMWTGHQYT